MWQGQGSVETDWALVKKSYKKGKNLKDQNVVFQRSKPCSYA